MAKTYEALLHEYEGREEDIDFLNQQAVLGTEEEAQSAFDSDGNFHCIKWFDCSHCPAFTAAHCL